MFLEDHVYTFCLLERTIKLLDKEFVERVLKGTESYELTDHEEDRLAGLSEDSPEKVDYLEICFACKHDSIEIGKKLGTTWEFFEPLLTSDSFKVFLELFLKIGCGESVSLVEE